MDFIRVPGKNGLGKTDGVEFGFENFSFDFELNLDLSDVSSQLKRIYSFAKKIKKKSFFFGGDHSISYPLIKGIWKNNSDLKVIILDAHPDLMEPIIEPTHEEWLRALVEQGFLCENILIIGVRKNSKNVDERELNFAKENSIKIIYSDEIESNKCVVNNFISSGKIYLSIDIDVLDKNVFSSTSYPERFGLNEVGFFNLINLIVSSKNFFYGDLVEVNLKKISSKENKIIRKILKRVDIG
jgi:agmatinase